MDSSDYFHESEPSSDETWDLLTPSKASNSADLQNLKRLDLELNVVALRRAHAIATEPGKIKDGWRWAILLVFLAVLYVKFATSSNSASDKRLADTVESQVLRAQLELCQTEMKHRDDWARHWDKLTQDTLTTLRYCERRNGNSTEFEQCEHYLNNE
ncbi:MAG: hypothetical protein Q9164_000671 [Protoblastenia rupestris]